MTTPKSHLDWMVEEGKRSIVEGVIIRHYRLHNAEAISSFLNPVNDGTYRTIRRGVRGIFTRTGLGNISDDELKTILGEIGLRFEGA